MTTSSEAGGHWGVVLQRSLELDTDDVQRKKTLVVGELKYRKYSYRKESAT